MGALPAHVAGAYLTGAFCLAATGAWYLLRREYHAEARIMVRMGLGLGAVLVPAQPFIGHLVGDYSMSFDAKEVGLTDFPPQDRLQSETGYIDAALPDRRTLLRRTGRTLQGGHEERNSM